MDIRFSSFGLIATEVLQIKHGALSGMQIDEVRRFIGETICIVSDSVLPIRSARAFNLHGNMSFKRTHAVHALNLKTNKGKHQNVEM